jgi:hypothetical protein
MADLESCQRMADLVNKKSNYIGTQCVQVKVVK